MKKHAFSRASLKSLLFWVSAIGNLTMVWGSINRCHAMYRVIISMFSLSFDVFFPFFSLAESSPRDLQISVLLQIMLMCNLNYLCENGGSVPRADREWLDIFRTVIEWWNNYWTRLSQNIVICQGLADQLLPQPSASASNWSALYWQIFCSTSLNNCYLFAATVFVAFAEGSATRDAKQSWNYVLAQYKHYSNNKALNCLHLNRKLKPATHPKNVIWILHNHFLRQCKRC